jgi:hypothetical protein
LVKTTFSYSNNISGFFFVDPKLIAFIRKRNKKQGEEEIIPINEQPIVQNMEIDNQTNLPIEVDSRWIHMNNIEHEKLEWIKDLPKPTAQRTTDESVRRRILCFPHSLISLEPGRCSSSI